MKWLYYRADAGDNAAFDELYRIVKADLKPEIARRAAIKGHEVLGRKFFEWFTVLPLQRQDDELALYRKIYPGGAAQCFISALQRREWDKDCFPGQQPG